MVGVEVLVKSTFWHPDTFLEILNLRSFYALITTRPLLLLPFNIDQISWNTFRGHLLFVITILENFIEKYEMNSHVKILMLVIHKLHNQLSSMGIDTVSLLASAIVIYWF